MHQNISFKSASIQHASPVSQTENKDYPNYSQSKTTVILPLDTYNPLIKPLFLRNQTGLYQWDNRLISGFR